MSHPHPYYDYKVGDQVAITTLAGPCIAFDEGLADFIHLVRTTTDKDLVITIPPKARLTPAFDRLVDATGCIVLVRESSGGYRDLRTGRWTPEIRPAASNRDDPRIVVSEAHFQQDNLTPLLTVSAAIYHRARLSTVLGRVAELICAHFMPEGTVLSWARTEPAGAVWDRKTFTKTARDNMPEAHMILAAHGPGRSVASGSMTINRTENGLEEYLEMTVLPTHIEPAWWQDRVNTFLQAVGTELKPQFALVFRTAGNDDGTFPPTARTVPTPMAVLIGAPGIRRLRVDPEAVAGKHRGSVTGRGRRHGVLIPLDSGREPAWDAMSSLLSTLDGDNGNLARVLAPKTSAGPAAAPSSHFGPKSQD